MIENKYSLKVNEKYEAHLGTDEIKSLDIISISNDVLHVLKDGKSFQVTIKEVNKQKKSVSILIGQELFEVKIKDSYDELIDQLGLSLNITHHVNDIKAPMPGLVLSIEVAEGQEIRQGDTLLILEAMKMENVIKSPGDGIVKSILTKKGSPVEKGEILLEMA
ncbi:MAG: acetyl-CoA carboxylase biotin carboxyl carrier protein subunit [Saprospiraceae bacterium]